MPTTYTVQELRDKVSVVERIARQLRNGDLINDAEANTLNQTINSVRNRLDGHAQQQQDQLGRRATIETTQADREPETVANTTHQRQPSRCESLANEVVANYNAANSTTSILPSHCPRKLADIKRECYNMVGVTNTVGLKRYLTRTGHTAFLNSLNLRKKAGWQSIWQFLKSSNENGIAWEQCGIEIEFAKSEYSTTPTTRTRVGGVLRYLKDWGYISEGWRSELDPSCGCEVVSPILYNKEQFRKEVSIVVLAIRRCGGRYTSHAGGHVHIDASNHRATDYIDIVRRYHDIFETRLQPMLTNARINNGFCVVKNGYDINRDEFEGRRVTGTATRLQNGDRYCAVNALTDGKGTIEYRQGNCILNQTIDETMAWVEMLQLIHHQQA